jgi:hypothetical protein
MKRKKPFTSSIFDLTFSSAALTTESSLELRSSGLLVCLGKNAPNSSTIPCFDRLDWENLRLMIGI